MLYLFEKYAGQDDYNSIIRKGMKDSAHWACDGQFNFFTVVGKLREGPGESKFDRNIEAATNGDRLPRQLYVRVAMDDQLSWTADQHNQHTKTLMAKLNCDPWNIADDQSVKPKEYYVDESESWITPEEKLPLGMYVCESRLEDTMLPLFFERHQLNQQWAKRYPEMINHFFVSGGSPLGISLGVPSDYYWETDPAVKAERTLRMELKSALDSKNIAVKKQEEIASPVTKEKEGGAVIGNVIPVSEESLGRRKRRHFTLEDSSSEESGGELTQRASRISKVVAQGCRKLKTEKQRAIRKKKVEIRNPFIDDEAVEDNDNSDYYTDDRSKNDDEED